MRVNELSKALGRTNKEVLELLRSHNYDVKSHSSNITGEQEALVRNIFGNNKPAGKPQAENRAEAPKNQNNTPAKAGNQAAGTPAQQPAKKETAPAVHQAAAGAQKAAGQVKKRFSAVFHPQNANQRGLFQRKPGQGRTGAGVKPAGQAPAASVNAKPAAPTAGTAKPASPAHPQENPAPAAASARPQEMPTAAKETAPEKKPETAAKAPARTEAPAAPREEQKPSASAGREQAHEAAPAAGTAKPASPARPQESQGTGRAGQSSFNGRDSHAGRDSRGSFGGNREGRGGYQGSRDGSRGGYQGAGRTGQGSFGSRQGSFGGNRDGRPGFNQGSRDGSRGYQGNRDGRGSFGGNREGRGGYQGSRDGNRGGYQGAGRTGQGSFGSRQGSFGGNRDGRPGFSQGSRDGNRGGSSFANRGRGGQGGRGGFEEKPLQKQQNNKQSRNAYKNTEKYSKMDRQEERHSKGRNAASRHQQPVKPVRQEPKEEQIKVVTLPEHLTIRELASRMKMQPAVIIKKLFLEGKVVTVNQDVTYDEAEEIALKFDILCEKEKKVDVIAELLREPEENPDDLVPRPPVVCVMGHVDHGKTSLLDAIRKTNVTAKEAGGITQRIGAYMVEINGQKITFLDTPGHEAFTAMRMRGAQATDIAVLVVAADDGVMPQTVEAINHAKAANVDLIVAINKIDKPNADPNKVKQELAQYGVMTEDWGGDVPCVEVSAKTHKGIPELLEMILLVAEVKELKANPNRNARGLIIEASLDKGRGPVATVLVQKGTLHVGDHVAAGPCFGKIRAMTNENGRRVREAGPSTPVEIIGFNDVPGAGEVFVQLDSEKEARSFAETYIAESKNQMIENSRQKISLDDLFSQIQAGNVKELPIIVKADVQGSVEAVRQSLEKLSNDEVAVKVIHSGVGAINESDVSLAAASNAIIIGFNVRPDPTAKSEAEHEKVDIRLYKVIYQAIDDVEMALKGMLEPIYEEQVIGHGVVRQIFRASKVGNIAGCYVTDGKFTRGCKARITRGKDQIFDGEVASLKRFKDDVKEVAAGFECGVVFDKFNDIQEDDEIEAYAMVEVPRT